MNLDPVQVMKGQSNPKDPTAAPVTASSNGDGKGAWEEKEEFDQGHLGLTTKPLLVSCQRRARKVEGGIFFPKPENAVTIAVSSRVLFRTETEQKVYEQKGYQSSLGSPAWVSGGALGTSPAWPGYQSSLGISPAWVSVQPGYQSSLGRTVQLEQEHGQPGDQSSLGPHVQSWDMVQPRPRLLLRQALEAVNARLRELYPESEELFDIVLVTYNHAHVGVRLINTINHHNLFIERFCMTGGSSPIGYLKAWQTNLYLSADAEKVREALSEGIAAATMFMSNKLSEVSQTQLRVAFDGDAVLFSDESERIFKAQGLDGFFQHERDNEDILLDRGPLKDFLASLGKLQKKFYAKGHRLDCPIRTYLVTARSAASSGIRALKTLRAWGLETDEALFLAGAPKGPMLEKIRPHIYFDDQMFHVEGAAEMGTVAAHVPYGIAQKHPHKKSLNTGK
uniref:cytosolic 5'-nucleotidase 1A-like n=1 Tax=Oncorhynchus gorbuscha TaxID=8017 RepID=UPI001EAF38E1|nr:cytosolic 5'-nucleotidase 1A-like [Oncorhynchus gorbuscha]